ncbi:MAG: phosphotransferase [Dehalococcoidia bacterium]
MMRVLLVEDEESEIGFVTDQFREAGLDVSVVAAKSKMSALSTLQDDEFDAFIFDLRIPTQDGALDKQEAHGLSVIESARLSFPGTPFCILTGKGTPELIGEALSNAPTRDLFGSGERPLSKFCNKVNYAPCIEWLAEICGQDNILKEIEIVGTVDGLSVQSKRALRIFARRRAGTILRVSPLGGGLSSASTMRAQVYDKDDGITATVVVKLAPLDRIEDERLRYETLITRLASGAFAHYVDNVVAGCGRTGGLFYRLAEDYVSLFDALQAAPMSGASIVQRLRDLQEPWRRDKSSHAVQIGALRRSFMADSEFDEHQPALPGVVLKDVEAKTIQVREFCQHGDLHGENVLIDSHSQPLLIDYGDVRMATASLDPVTLELSLAFHPEGRAVSGGWPSTDAASRWAELDEYTRDCPFADFVNACREWALDDSLSQYAVYANAYGYAVRQLRFQDVDPNLALAVAGSACTKLLSS